MDSGNTNVNMVLHGVSLVRKISVKPDGDSKQSKKMTVTTKYDGATLNTVLDDANKTDIIRLQRSLREKYDDLTDGGTIDRVYGAKPSAVITPDVAKSTFTNHLTTLSVEDREIAIANMIEQMNAVK